ncbi:MAG TPA: hypothetical protein VNY05_23310, partial [Candidatus Acidoferrales bacterium]|nr:hypothetical protein [Candidatus Acidoferrales bacterium]
MKTLVVAATLLLQAPAADLQPRTVEAFDRYVRDAEARMDAAKSFLWADESPDRARRVRQGEVVAEPFSGKPDIGVGGGLVHDWVGVVFIPGAPVDYTIARLEDYDSHKDIFKPEVIDSRTLSHTGNDYLVYLRLVKKRVVTVVLNTEFEVRYTHVDKTRWSSVSRSRKVAEVERAGKPDERELPPGTGEPKSGSSPTWLTQSLAVRKRGQGQEQRIGRTRSEPIAKNEPQKSAPALLRGQLRRSLCKS